MARRGGVGTASGILRDTGGMGDAPRSNGSCLCNAAVLVPTDLDVLADVAAAASRCQ
jgi:hypothetical protein